MIRTEDQSLSEEVGSYRFSICIVMWYDILRQIQHVSKLMKSLGVHVDAAVSLLRQMERGLSNYRATGFMTAQTSTKDMNVEAVLQQKRLRATKRHFSYESCGDPLSDALKKLEVTFFHVVTDAAISALHERFSTLDNVGEKVRSALNLPKSLQ